VRVEHVAQAIRVQGDATDDEAVLRERDELDLVRLGPGLGHAPGGRTPRGVEHDSEAVMETTDQGQPSTGVIRVVTRARQRRRDVGAHGIA